MKRHRKQGNPCRFVSFMISSYEYIEERKAQNKKIEHQIENFLEKAENWKIFTKNLYVQSVQGKTGNTSP